MVKLTTGTVARAYLVVVLVMSILFASPVQLGVALFLLALQLYSVYKLPKANVNLVLVVATLVLAPLALEALVGVYAFVFILPGLVLFDEGLKATAPSAGLGFGCVGRRASDVLKVLCGCLALVFGVSVLVWNASLMLTAAVLLGFTGYLVLSAVRKVPKVALTESKSWTRIVAGDTEIANLTLTSKADVPLSAKLVPVDSWVQVGQENFTLSALGNAETSLRFTPPLAGPSKLQLKAATTDPHGLIITQQQLTPLDLHIIPRAKYAHWLAAKYLEQTSSGAGIMVEAQRSNASTAKHGVEFQGNRPHQVGDRLKDIDWKHSCMLGELIVKEFSGAQGNTGIIVADLTAKDPEGADRLAYNLVMTALTLATESLPSALALYNQNEVVAVTKPMNSRETLKRTLELTEKIAVTKLADRVLEPAQLRMVKRSVEQLEQVEVAADRNLSQLLRLEIQAHAEAAKTHPSTLALAKAVKYLQGPAVITLISSAGSDSEALSLEIDLLKERGFSAVMVNTANVKSKTHF